MILSEFIKHRAKYFDKTIEYFEDKVKANKYCRNNGIPVPKIFFTLKYVKNLINVNLPKNCILKFNNLQCSNGIVVKRNNKFIGFNNKHEIVKYLNDNKNQLKGQISIRNIPQKLIVEELLESSEPNNILYDIKCMMLYGEVKFALIIDPNQRNIKYVFDSKGNRIFHIFKDDIKYKNINFKLPKYFFEIIDLCKKITKNNVLEKYIFRLDFYSTTKGPMFGEFTFNPWAGNGFCDSFDINSGKIIKNHDLMKYSNQ